VKGSARVVEPPRIEYKGFKYKYSVKGDVVRSWVVRSVFSSNYKDNSTINFNNNASIIISKKQNIKSKFVNGPLPLTIRTKKLNSIFTRVF
jgi:ribosomal protein L14